METRQAQNLVQELTRQVEVYIMNQIGELVNRGLIVVESTRPVITEVQGPGYDKRYEISQAVKLIPANFDYIQKLEKEVEELTEYKKRIQSLLGAL